jgi:hypothetical protein
MEVLTPAPERAKCRLNGDALKVARAREVMTFECEFIVSIPLCASHWGDTLIPPLVPFADRHVIATSSDRTH